MWVALDQNSYFSEKMQLSAVNILFLVPKFWLQVASCGPMKL